MDALIRKLLAVYPSSWQPRSGLESLGNAGGLSGTRLWRFESGCGRLAIRAWPEVGPSPERLRQIHHWLSLAGPLGFVPLPLPALDGRTFQSLAGRLWQVEPWMSGASAARGPREAQVRAALSGLASFHQTLARFGTRGPVRGSRPACASFSPWSRGGSTTSAAFWTGRDPIANGNSPGDGYRRPGRWHLASMSNFGTARGSRSGDSPVSAMFDLTICCSPGSD